MTNKPKESAKRNCEESWFSLLKENRRIVCQKGFKVGCGYAALLNSLLSNKSAFHLLPKLTGTTDLLQLSYLRDKYGNLPSTNHKKGKRQLREGLVPEDLLEIFNELRTDFGLSRVSGMSLERQTDKDESHKEHAKRVHQLLLNSLLADEAPIILARSQAIVNAKSMRLLGHYLTVCEIQRSPNKDGSFLLGYLDSEDGNSHIAFVYSDPRGFSAYFGHDEKKTLLTDSPFLAMVGSGLTLKTKAQRVSRRTVIYIEYAIVARD